MSGNLNPASATARRVLIVAANPAVSPTTGWPIGFWAAELVHPYLEFTEAGYEVTIASPDGGDLAIDGYSDPRHESGYAADDIQSLGFLTSPKHAALLKGTRAISQIDMAAYDALFLVGGQSPMVTFIENAALHAFVARAWEAGKVVAAVCHATCALLKVRTADGKLLVEGRTWTGFADAEERFADGFVGMKIQPFWIEEQARKLPDTNFIVGAPFSAFAYRDGRLVTGQQQFSGTAAARLVVEALGR